MYHSILEIIRRQMELTLPGLALQEHISQSFIQGALNLVDHSSMVPDFVASEYHSNLSLFIEWRKEDNLRSQHVTREENNSLLIEWRQYEFKPDTLISQPGIHFIQASKPH